MKVLSKIDFVTQSNSIHNNLYNYDLISDDISLKLTTKVSIIDPLYGQFTTTIKRHLAGITNVKRKSAQTGSMNALSHETFIHRASTLHNNYYDYSYTIYTKMHTKVKIIDPIYGEFFQTPMAHLQGQGHPAGRYEKSSAKRRIGDDEFINRAKTLHGNLYDYSKVVYKQCDKKVCIIDPVYGEFWQSPYQHLNSHGCPERTANKEWLIHIDHIIPLSILYTRNKSHNRWYTARPLYILLNSDINLKKVDATFNIDKTDFVIVNGKKVHASTVRNNYGVISHLIKELLHIDPNKIIEEDVNFINSYFGLA